MTKFELIKTHLTLIEKYKSIKAQLNRIGIDVDSTNDSLFWFKFVIDFEELLRDYHSKTEVSKILASKKYKMYSAKTLYQYYFRLTKKCK